jgi:type II secretory pathway pseudopilin PulG
MRKAFSLVTAIVTIVIIASLFALVSSLAGKITKETTAQYRKEQAMLLAKSYTEFALLAIQGHDTLRNGCLNTIVGDIDTTAFNQSFPGAARNGAGYRTRVNLRYIGIDCSTTPPTIAPYIGASTATSAGVIVDVVVRYKEIDHANPSTAEVPWMSYGRRTLQKL